jgi:hypothetical protein
MTVIGYGRVSTTDQDLSIQDAALRAAGCEVIRPRPPDRDRGRTHPLRRRAPQGRHRFREGKPVADRAHGPVLRSACNRPHRRGFGSAVIPAFYPPEMRGKGSGAGLARRRRTS